MAVDVAQDFVALGDPLRVALGVGAAVAGGHRHRLGECGVDRLLGRDAT